VIVDAIRTGGPVGHLHRLDVDCNAPPPDEFSLHGIGVEHLVAALLIALASQPPALVLIGAEVGEISPFTTELTPLVAAAVPQAVKLVARECTRGCKRPTA
jgi:hydrogenase maturation protease